MTTDGGTDEGPRMPARALAIENETGTPFREWVRIIDDAGGRDLDHTGIARMLVDQHHVGGWWAQGITVSYEQWIGRREEGQSSTGDFSASASRTVPGAMDAVADAFDLFMAPRQVEIGIEDMRRTETAKWRYWRADISDGSRLAVNLSAKNENRCVLAVEHKGIAAAKQRDTWKTLWKQTLTEFATEMKQKNS